MNKALKRTQERLQAARWALRYDYGGVHSWYPCDANGVMSSQHPLRGDDCETLRSRGVLRWFRDFSQTASLWRYEDSETALGLAQPDRRRGVRVRMSVADAERVMRGDVPPHVRARVAGALAGKEKMP